MSIVVALALRACIDAARKDSGIGNEWFKIGELIIEHFIHKASLHRYCSTEEHSDTVTIHWYRRPRESNDEFVASQQKCSVCQNFLACQTLLI